MNRTLIELSNDGNILVTRQANVKPTGNSNQRRQQVTAGVTEEWRRTDRVIVRDRTTLPEHVKEWLGIEPNGGMEHIGFDNDLATLTALKTAHDIVAEIDAHNAAFAIAPAKKWQVVLLEVI